tara:strand:- start:82 stop:504 length:423 start_codon:yes stop_codon:yes gene_type:complete
LTQVDFYQIESSESALLFACRLIEKVYRLKHKIHVHTASNDEAEALDDLLWTFKPESFIPHERYGSVLAAPVQICHQANPVLHQDVLINLSASIPDFFSRFKRVAEIVPQETERRDSARESFRFYQERGYPLNYHKMGQR